MGRLIQFPGKKKIKIIMPSEVEREKLNQIIKHFHDKYDPIPVKYSWLVLWIKDIEVKDLAFFFVMILGVLNIIFGIVCIARTIWRHSNG